MEENKQPQKNASFPLPKLAKNKFKSLAVLVGFVFFLSIAFGNSKPDSVISQVASANGNNVACAKIIEAAKTTMSARQNGVGLNAALGAAGRDPFLQQMVTNAWAQPRYNTDVQKQRMIVGFAWDYEQACLAGSGRSVANVCERAADEAERVMTLRFEQPMHYDLHLVEASRGEFGMEIVHDAFRHPYTDDPNEVKTAILEFRTIYKDACEILISER